MRWGKLQLNDKLRGTPDGEKSSGLTGETFGPGRRWGHSCNAINGGKFLYVFGGYGEDNCQTNDVHVFDTVRHTWSKPMVKGIPPSPRDSHSCTTVGEKLFVFGGTDGKNPLKDLHILDTSSNTWISPRLSGKGPEAREGHSAALIGKQLFLFGGCGKSWNNSDEVYYNDLYILDTVTLVWKRAITSGTSPSARDSHTCSSWKNKIIVVGGEDASDFYLSDVHILDTDTLVWRELSTSGQILSPRAGHSTVSLGKNLFVFGGFTDDRYLYDDLYMLNMDTGFWTKVMATGQTPSPRFSVSGDCLDLPKGVLVFIGGCNKHLEALDDMYYLYTVYITRNFNGNVQDEKRHEKLSLRKQLKKKCQEQNLSASLPKNDNGVLKIGTMADFCRPMPLPSYGQEGKQNSPLNEFKPQENIFEAKVTEGFHYGYTIETVIDGKPLRGILFSNKPSFPHADNDYLSRKRTTVEVGGVKLNEGHNSKLKTGRSVKQEAVDYGKTDGVHGKKFKSQESQIRTAFASNPNKSALVDGFHPHIHMIPTLNLENHSG